MIRSRDEREGEPARLLSWPRASPVLSRDPARRLRSTVSPRGSGPWEHTAHPSGQLTVAPLYCFLRCVQSLRPPHAEVRPPRPDGNAAPRRAQSRVASVSYYRGAYRLPGSDARKAKAIADTRRDIRVATRQPVSRSRAPAAWVATPEGDELTRCTPRDNPA